MTPEAQRIAIAEACGWERPDIGGYWKNTSGNAEMLPFYPHDLNAMHEAEKVLSDKQYLVFLDELAAITTNRMVRIGDSIRNARPLMTATAAQRAEAFLRTLNLWTAQ